MVDPLDDDDLPERGMAWVGAAFYAVLIGAGYVWLSARGRTAALPLAAGGSLGLLASAAVGAAVGLSVAGVSAWLARDCAPFARLEVRLAGLLGPINETEALVLALSSAIGEEFFFRMAMQDALGPVATALLYGAVCLGPRDLWLAPVLGLTLGTGFGWMMASGAGLLSVTAAHALINYVALRRLRG